MIALVLRRLLYAVIMVVLVSLIMFLLVGLIPGDPATAILGDEATAAQIEALRAELGLNLPWYERYFNWLLGLFQGDLGRSIFSGEDVLTLLNLRLPVTLSLMLLSTIVIAVIGGTLGLLSAVRGGWVGRTLDAISLVGLALPSFWVAVVLVVLFAVTWPIFPATGFVPINVNPSLWLMSLVLPVAAMSLTGVTMVAKQMRDSALDAMSRDYTRVLRANGVSERSILFKHILRNASVPSTTVLGMTVASAATGAVFVENVFVLPGLGAMAVTATLNSDMPVILGLGVYFTVVTIVINLIVDFLYGVLNPKIRAL